jgi:hypothetical protein
VRPFWLVLIKRLCGFPRRTFSESSETLQISACELREKRRAKVCSKPSVLRWFRPSTSAQLNRSAYCPRGETREMKVPVAIVSIRF